MNDFAFKPGQLNFSSDVLPDDTESKYTHDEIELDEDEKMIYSLIQAHNEITADNLAEESKLDLLSVQSVLASLIAEGLVSENSGRYSVRV